MKQRNLASLLLAGAMTATLLTGPAQAAESPSPQEIAATRLQAEGLMNGDEHGDLHLDKGLTRAELACLISPIVLNPEHVAWERDYYANLCTTNFSDVPEWAQVAVGVCASMGVVDGYRDGRFGPNDPVSPQMACTVMLRYLERDGWTYATACDKAVELGLAPASALQGDEITRGDTAILLDGTLEYLEYLQTL
jgi:hypothetical protein